MTDNGPTSRARHLHRALRRNAFSRTVVVRPFKIARIARLRHGNLLGLFAFSAFVPLIAVLLLWGYGSWRVWPVLLAVGLFAASLVRVIVELSLRPHEGWSEITAILLVCLAALAGVPCCSGPGFGGEYSDQMAAINERTDALYEIAETRTLTPDEKFELSMAERQMTPIVMRLTLTILLWQYGFVATALGFLSAGRRPLVPLQVVAGYERRTTFVLAALALFLAVLVITIKVAVAIGVVTFESWVDDEVTRQSNELIRVLIGSHPELAAWVDTNSWRATSGVSNITRDIRAACALTIWEISLLLAGLVYFAVDQNGPRSAFRDGLGPAWQYRLVAGALTSAARLHSSSRSSASCR